MSTNPGTRRRDLGALAGLTSLALVAAGLIMQPAFAVSETLVINEVYARGGSANQPYNTKFVELYNRSSAPVNLADYALRYSPATSTGYSSTCDLTGTVPAGGYFLVSTGTNGQIGDALPTVDQSCALNPSGTNGAFTLTMGGEPTVVDRVGYGTAVLFEGAAATYTGGNSTAGSITRTNGKDTDNNAADFSFTATPTPQNSQTEVSATPSATASTSQTASASATASSSTMVPEVTIAEIQGTGSATPLDGQRVLTKGVVTAAYPTGGFSGIYIQTPGSGGVAKAPGDASDGIFVYSPWASTNTVVGDCVEVTGTAGEHYGLTQLSTNPFVQKTTGCDAVKPTALETLPVTDAEKEVYEGMLVNPLGTYTITNNYQLNQYGQLGLAVGDSPLLVATDAVPPGEAAAAYEAANLKKYITLDDGSSWDYMKNKTAQSSPLPYLSQDTPMRTASHVTFAKPVILDFRFQWNYQPTGQVVGADSPNIPVTSANDRPVSPPSFGGDITVGSFNVLNYFTDLGANEDGCKSYDDREGNPVGTNRCQVRGAYTAAAFADQKAKIVSAINGLDASVVGLMEIENSAGITYISHERDYALADLVAGLNAAAGSEKWAFAPSPTVVPPNEDVIRTAFIYQPVKVSLEGPSMIMLDEAFGNARYPLAQTFKAVGSDTTFVAIVNHFKSKGSGPDDGTGQGNSNPSREVQARALSSWANEMFADKAIFLLGDFNAYTKETPLQIIEAAGYTNVVTKYEPDSTTYQFGGRLGSLDHAFANAKALALVTGAGVWNINGDESIAMQYSRRNYNVVDFHTTLPYASSDHDPLIVGVKTTKDEPSQPPTQSASPSVEPSQSQSPSESPSGSPTSSPSSSPTMTPTSTPTVTPRPKPGLPKTGN